MDTAKKILERQYRLHHPLSKFDGTVFLNSKPISYFFGFYMAWFYLETMYWSELDQDLMAGV